MKKINPDFIRLKDIISAIEDIENFYEDGGLEERKNIMAIAYLIAIIGESANKLSESLKQNNADIPWRAIIGMRNRIIHDYGSVDIDNLRQAIIRDLPSLKLKISEIINNL